MRSVGAVRGEGWTGLSTITGTRTQPETEQIKFSLDYLLQIKILLMCNVQIYIFKASALWADAFYKSKCPSVCVYVCPSVHL